MAVDLENPSPFYRQVIEDLRAQVNSGQLKAGDQIPSQRELAQRYGVSSITIKRALTELISEGLLLSRAGKGTFVAQPKRAITYSDRALIGLVLRDLRDPFFSLIVHSVQGKAADLGYNILLSNTSNLAEEEESQVTRFRQLGVSGLIIASMSYVHRATDVIKSLQREKFPLVMVSYVEDEDISYIGTDHRYGAFIATEHLISLGYKKIGYISGEEGNVLGDLRGEGYRQALERHGLPVDESLVYQLLYNGEWNHYQSGYEIGQLVVKQPDRPDAIFAYNDLSALGFEQGILANGLRIPEDVAIVGFDDIERDLHAPVPLTTVHQPTTLIGHLAVETLIDKVNGDHSVIRTFLKPRLVVRESCGGVPTSACLGAPEESPTTAVAS
ncbi:MAG: GntR family transcriptional regulator [Candidatus Neomarinimicrobiota bacterium]